MQNHIPPFKQKNFPLPIANYIRNIMLKKLDQYL